MTISFRDRKRAAVSTPILTASLAFEMIAHPGTVESIVVPNIPILTPATTISIYGGQLSKNCRGAESGRRSVPSALYVLFHTFDANQRNRDSCNRARKSVYAKSLHTRPGKGNVRKNTISCDVVVVQCSTYNS